jgi:hypothetical protein
MVMKLFKVYVERCVIEEEKMFVKAETEKEARKKLQEWWWDEEGDNEYGLNENIETIRMEEISGDIF